MKCKLKDFCTVINGRAYSQKELLDKGKYRVLRVGNFFSSDRWYFSDLELPAEKYCNKGDLLFAWACSFGPRIWNGEDRTIFHYHIWKLDIDSNIVDKMYLFYLLKISVDSMTAGTHGSVMMHITKSDMENFEFDIPTLEVQKKIAAILSALDEKIATNRAINENLERQAMALYAEMFLNSSNNDVTSGTLSDIAVITMGQSPSGSSYNEDGIGEVFYQGRAEFGFRFPKRRLFTTEPKRMAETGDVLLSVRAPVGELNVAYERCCIGRGLGAIHSKTGHSSFVLYTMFALRSQLDVFNGEGTVFGSINRDALNAIPIDVPLMTKIDRFEAVAHPIDELIRTNYEENCRLEAIRDSLLPKLMSGEIDVSSVQF